MKHNAERTLRSSIGIMGIAALAGCATDDRTEEIASTQRDPLQIRSDAIKWPNNEIRTCWTAHAGTHANAATLMAFVQRRLGETWGKVARVKFTGWGNCPATPQGVVTIDFIDGQRPNSGGFGYPGATGHFDMVLDPTRGDWSNSLIPHEFGHILGFSHEMARNDFTDDATGDCRESNASGDYLGTPKDDRSSIMAATGYCNRNTDLDRWDIVGVRNAYGLKLGGMIVGPTNHCVDVPLNTNPPPTGTDLQIFDCTGDPSPNNQSWGWTNSNQLRTPITSNAYMDIEGATGAVGSKVQIYTQNVPVTTNQQFSFQDVDIRAIGETCVDVPNGNFADQQGLQIFGCRGGSNQKWTLTKDSSGNITFQHGAYCWDIPNGSATLGNAVQLYSCHGGSTQKFTLTSQGEIRFGSMCVDVRGGSPNDQAALQLYSCKSTGDYGKQNQLFHITGQVRSMGKCLSVIGNANFSNGMGIDIQNCDATKTNQIFDYYWAYSS